jgi:hypothetical protein
MVYVLNVYTHLTTAGQYSHLRGSGPAITAHGSWPQFIVSFGRHESRQPQVIGCLIRTWKNPCPFIYFTSGTTPATHSEYFFIPFRIVCQNISIDHQSLSKLRGEIILWLCSQLTLFQPVIIIIHPVWSRACWLRETLSTACFNVTSKSPARPVFWLQLTGHARTG